MQLIPYSNPEMTIRSSRQFMKYDVSDGLEHERVESVIVEQRSDGGFMVQIVRERCVLAPFGETMVSLQTLGIRELFFAHDVTGADIEGMRRKYRNADFTFTPYAGRYIPWRNGHDD